MDRKQFRDLLTAAASTTPEPCQAARDCDWEAKPIRSCEICRQALVQRFCAQGELRALEPKVFGLVASMFDEIDAQLAKAFEPPRCAAWEGGSGGHREYKWNCSTVPSWYDPEDGVWLCEEHGAGNRQGAVRTPWPLAPFLAEAKQLRAVAEAAKMWQAARDYDRECQREEPAFRSDGVVGMETRAYIAAERALDAALAQWEKEKARG